MEISVNKDGEDLGPFSLEDIQAQLADGSLSLEDYAWFDGCEDWAYVADIPGVQEGGTSSPKSGGDPDGVYLEHNEEQKGPFPVAQLQGMVNQGVFPMDTPAWMEGWGDWGTIEDVPGIKKPRVKVSGSANPLASLSAKGGDKKDKKAKKGKKKEEKESSSEEKKAGGRTRRKKGREQQKKTLKQKLVPIISTVVILILLGVGGLFAYLKFFTDDEADDGGGGIFNTIKKTVKEDPPPEDPWDLAKWRKARQR